MGTEPFRKTLDEATPEEARAFARVAFGLDLDKHCGKDVVRAKLAEVGFTGDTIVIQTSGPTVQITAPQHLTPGKIPPESYYVNEAEKVPDHTWQRPRDAEGKPDKRAKAPLVPREYVCIIIPSTERYDGREPVRVAVNGMPMLIPRDQACWVPLEYHGVLVNAKVTVYQGGELQPDGTQSSLEAVGREVMNYPFVYATAPFKPVGSVRAA